MGDRGMFAASTDALVACLRALSNESRRVEQKLKGRPGTAKSQLLAHYLMDLQEALAAAAEFYEQLRTQDPTLTPADQLLAHFARSDET